MLSGREDNRELLQLAVQHLGLLPPVELDNVGRVDRVSLEPLAIARARQPLERRAELFVKLLHARRVQMVVVVVADQHGLFTSIHRNRSEKSSENFKNHFKSHASIRGMRSMSMGTGR